jgi:mannose-1-phosphate guanylyltransferase
MIERVLEQLAQHGIDEAVLSLGYRPKAFMDAYPDGKCAGVKLIYAVEDTPLDTAGAIAFAARQAGVADTFVVVNGDVLTGLDVAALIDFHQARRAQATIALTPVDDPSAFGVVPTDANGRVLAFIEKPPPGEAPTNLINAGTYVLEPSVLDRIPGGRRVSIERDTFPSLVPDGGLFAWPSDAYWVDAGTPATYLAANLLYAASVPSADRGAGDVQAGAGGGTSEIGQLYGGVEPDRDVVGRRGVSEGGGAEVDGSAGWANGSASRADGPSDARLGAGAVVTCSVLGDGVTIGDGATIDRSVLFAGASVGPGAEVRSSILGRGARVEAGAAVTEFSVVGDEAVVAAGSHLSGARVSAAS